MLKYATDRARPGLVAFYDIRPGNRAGLFLHVTPEPSFLPYVFYSLLRVLSSKFDNVAPSKLERCPYQTMETWWIL